MKKFLLFALFSTLYFSSRAQLNYNFNTLTGSATSGVPSGFSASDVSAGNTNKTSDFFTTVSPSSGYNGASGSGNITTAAKGGSAATDISSLSYYEFTITPSATDKVKIYGSYIRSFIVRSSVVNLPRRQFYIPKEWGFATAIIRAFLALTRTQ